MLAACLLVALPLPADDNAAPDMTNAPSAQTGNFSDYLVAHQDDITPFFSKNGDTLIKVLVPVLLQLFGHIIFIALLAGWAINVFLGRCFTAFFAPVYAKLKYAVIYATGEWILSLLFAGLLAFLIIAFPGLVQSAPIFLLLVIAFVVIPFVIHVAWVRYTFRTDSSTSAFFYLGILLVHGITIVLTMAPVGAQAPASLVAYVDQNITPELRGEVEESRKELIAAGQAQKEMKGKVADLQAQLTQTATDQANLQKEIEAQKVSEAYLFSRIAQVRAKGDLSGARTQFKDLIAKFPDGAMTDAAKTQVASIESDISAQDAQQKKAAADAAQALATARADLLARAAKGEVTLSEMRRAIVGKNLADIKQLFGLPTEVGPDRWGYGQQMISDPLNDRKTGLAVYFSEGVVQSVDYYYGVVPAK